MAFQEGFERLFDIMSGEGMLEGGSVIVKDCLHVCTNLLSGSSLTKVTLCLCEVHARWAIHGLFRVACHTRAKQKRCDIVSITFQTTLSVALR